MIGTLAYISPEAFQKRRYSFPSDVWSLGCVIQYLCTGERPYHGSTTDPRTALFVIAGHAYYLFQNQSDEGPPLPQGFNFDDTNAFNYRAECVKLE